VKGLKHKKKQGENDGKEKDINYTRVHLIVLETTRTKVPRTLPICVGSDVLTLLKNSILPGGCRGFGFNSVCGTFLQLDN
jgi:hypothetical protein